MAEPTSTEKESQHDVDRYTGTAEQLIAAGLVRADQFPPPGRQWITYQNGEPVRAGRNPPKDERFFRVERMWTKGQYRVWVGVSAEVQRQRWRAKQEADSARERQRVQEIAAAGLRTMPRTADAFRRLLVHEVRFMMRLTLEDVPRRMGHGFSLSAESLEHALQSVDAVVEAVMQADVDFDHARHLALVNKHQAAIVAGHPDLAGQVAALTRPNASLLLGEVQP